MGNPAYPGRKRRPNYTKGQEKGLVGSPCAVQYFFMVRSAGREGVTTETQPWKGATAYLALLFSA